MSGCQCENCVLGRRIQTIVDKYKLDKDDALFLANNVFGLIEHLQDELTNLKAKKGVTK